MGRFSCSTVSVIVVLTGSVLGTLILGPAAEAQAVPTESALSSSITAVAPTHEAADVALDPASLLPDLPALPRTKASLVGGTIQRLDRVRDVITVQAFGGSKMKIAFDTRTQIFNNGAQGAASDLRQGDRVYVDTILDGSTVFARSIRLKTSNVAGESQGTVTSYRADKGELEIRDALSPRVLKVRVTPQTRFMQGNQAFSARQIVPGTLVTVKFGPQQGGGDVAQELSILAVPGSRFTFAGRVVSLDLRLGVLTLDSSNDHKTYEIYFDPATVAVNDKLRETADVTVETRFDGSRYTARTLTVNPSTQQ